MGSWTAEQLARIGAADEVEVAPVNADGSLSPYRTIWVVRVGDDLYVRSYRGDAGGWYRHAQRSRRGRIQTGGLQSDITFEPAADADQGAIDDAYRRKYGHASSYVAPMIRPDAVATTMGIMPA